MSKVRERRYPRVRSIQGGESKTEQSHRDGCTIRKIMEKYHKTGVLQERLSRGVYGDFSAVGDYRDCLRRVRDAQEDFAALPSQLRKRFRNDPAELIAFIGDPANREEAMKLGLLPQRDAEGQAQPEPDGSAEAAEAATAAVEGDGTSPVPSGDSG